MIWARMHTVLAMMHMYPRKIIVQCLILVHLRRHSLQTLDSLDIVMFLYSIKASPFFPERRVFTHCRRCSIIVQTPFWHVSDVYTTGKAYNEEGERSAACQNSKQKLPFPLFFRRRDLRSFCLSPFFNILYKSITRFVRLINKEHSTIVDRDDENERWFPKRNKWVCFLLCKPRR
jgi:hypothetical protein